MSPGASGRHRKLQLSLAEPTEWTKVGSSFLNWIASPAAPARAAGFGPVAVRLIVRTVAAEAGRPDSKGAAASSRSTTRAAYDERARAGERVTVDTYPWSHLVVPSNHAEDRCARRPREPDRRGDGPRGRPRAVLP